MAAATPTPARDPGNGAAGLRPVMASLIALTGLFSLNFTCRVILAPLLPTIETDLGLSHTSAGALFMILSTGYVTALILSGFASARLTHRSVIGFSTVILGLLLVLTRLADSLIMLRICLVTIGLAAGVYFPSSVATITGFLNQDMWGRGLAIHAMAPAACFFLTPLAAEGLLLVTSWRGVLTIIGGVTALCGVIYLLTNRAGRFSGQAPDLASLRLLLGQPMIWLLAVLTGLGIGCNQGVFNMLPLYLMEISGLDRSQANLLVAMSRVSPLFVLPLAGWLADRVGHRRAMTAALAGGGLVTVLMGVADGWLLTGVVFVHAPVMIFFFPAVFATTSEMVEEKYRSLAVSLTVAGGFFLGIGLVPLWLGWLGDQGLFRWGVAGLGVVMILGAAVSPLVKNNA